MASTLTMQMPFVIASLPRPVNHSSGRYVVSDVHGVERGSRKRKRGELAVGIDGEGLNIYSTRASKLITTYALPPQSVFTCPPCSLRLKKNAIGRPERRSYVSIQDNGFSVQLFREWIAVDGTTESKLSTHVIQGSKKPAVFTGTILGDGDTKSEDMILVKQDGEIQCLDGEDLSLKWTSPASTIASQSQMPDVLSHNVEFASLTDAHTAGKGLLKDRPDAFSAFPHPISLDGFNPPLLILITSPSDPALSSSRTLHVLASPRLVGDRISNNVQSMQTIFTIPLPWTHGKLPHMPGDSSYDIHESSGMLYELTGGVLRGYDMTKSFPRVKTQLLVESASSFLRLTDRCVVTTSPKSINVYNPTFNSLQAFFTLDSDEIESAGRKRKIGTDGVRDVAKRCQLVSHSAAQNIVLAIIGNDLTAFPIEGRKDISDQSRPQGLLIDSIGRGISRPRSHSTKLQTVELQSFGAYVPGSIREKETFEQKILELDQCVAEDDVEIFEVLIMPELGIKYEDKSLTSAGNTKTNGLATTNGGISAEVNGVKEPSSGEDSPMRDISDENTGPTLLWPRSRSEYPDVDHRWIQYALSRIFSWSNDIRTKELRDSSADGEYELNISFLPHNVIHWLIETGNMNRANIESSLNRGTLRNGLPPIPAGQIVKALVGVDPEMKMLISLITATYLDAPELLHAIRLLMQSLELFGDGSSALLALLPNGEPSEFNDGDIEAEIASEEAKAQAALQLAEYQLEDSSNLRGQALSLALAKLHSHPPSTIAKALNSTFSSSEIVSLIYLLRFELARGAWTSRYLDSTVPNSATEEDEVENNTILLVSNLLNTCIDAIGAGGWLSRTTMGDEVFDSEDLISSLKLEISAALECIEEVTYLKGLTSEIVRYGQAVQKAIPGGRRTDTSNPNSVYAPGFSAADPRRTKNKPITLPDIDRDANLLPMGLKADKQISMMRVGAGGELSRRTLRDIGHLKSKKVGKYSLERIVI